jgi:hypothetical protein
MAAQERRGFQDDCASDQAPVSIGRALAARALVAAGRTQQRVATLLETSRRSVGRAGETDLAAALHDAAVVTEARSVLAATARQGSTDAERDAALAWLQEAARDEHQAERDDQADRTQASRRVAARRPAPRHPARPSRNGAHRHGAATLTAVLLDPPARASLDHVDALRRQQQRILHRTELLNYVLTAEKRSGAPLTMGDALAELLGDIAEAARAIGTLLPATNG